MRCREEKAVCVAVVYRQVWVVTHRNDVTPQGFSLGLPLPSLNSRNGLEDYVLSSLRRSRMEESEATGGEGAAYKDMLTHFGVNPQPLSLMSWTVTTECQKTSPLPLSEEAVGWRPTHTAWLLDSALKITGSFG